MTSKVSKLYEPKVEWTYLMRVFKQTYLFNIKNPTVY